MADDIHRSLGRIEGKLDLFLDTQKTHAQDIEDLQAFKNRSLGIVAFISGVVGAFSSSISDWFKSA